MNLDEIKARLRDGIEGRGFKTGAFILKKINPTWYEATVELRQRDAYEEGSVEQEPVPTMTTPSLLDVVGEVRGEEPQAAKPIAESDEPDMVELGPGPDTPYQRLSLEEVFGPPDVEALIADNQRLRGEIERKDRVLGEEIARKLDAQAARPRVVFAVEERHLGPNMLLVTVDNHRVACHYLNDADGRVVAAWLDELMQAHAALSLLHEVASRMSELQLANGGMVNLTREQAQRLCVLLKGFVPQRRGTDDERG